MTTKKEVTQIPVGQIRLIWPTTFGQRLRIAVDFHDCAGLDEVRAKMAEVRLTKAGRKIQPADWGFAHRPEEDKGALGLLPHWTPDGTLEGLSGPYGFRLGKT